MFIFVALISHLRGVAQPHNLPEGPTFTDTMLFIDFLSSWVYVVYMGSCVLAVGLLVARKIQRVKINHLVPNDIYDIPTYSSPSAVH